MRDTDTKLALSGSKDLRRNRLTPETRMAWIDSPPRGKASPSYISAYSSLGLVGWEGLQGVRFAATALTLPPLQLPVECARERCEGQPQRLHHADRSRAPEQRGSGCGGTTPRTGCRANAWELNLMMCSVWNNKLWVLQS